MNGFNFLAISLQYLIALPVMPTEIARIGRGITPNKGIIKTQRGYWNGHSRAFTFYILSLQC